MLCYAMLCYAVLCYAMLRYAMLCYALLCYATLCYATLCLAGPLPELSRDTWETACPPNAGLCAIALLDGSPGNGNQEAHLEMSVT
jgi:hypothetical protein